MAFHHGVILMADDDSSLDGDDSFGKDMEPISNTSVSPGIGIGAIALNFALKYHGINTVQDGALYQQYKLEGKTMRSLHLDDVFETAIKMERHLLATSDRIAKVVVEAVAEGLKEELEDNFPEKQDNPEKE